MKKEVKNRIKDISKKVIYAVIILLVFSFIDFIILRQVYDPLIKKFAIPESAFTLNLFGKIFYMLLWHIVLILSSIICFLIVAFVIRSWRFFVSGVILIATGWEDILYYVIQLKFLPSELPWLDYSPLMTLSRFVTRTEHVSNFGVLISALFGILIILLISLPIINNSKRKIKK